MIELTEGTVSLLIGVLREHIFVHTGDMHSDKATHPIEVNLLDQLIEKRVAAMRAEANNRWCRKRLD